MTSDINSLREIIEGLSLENEAQFLSFFELIEKYNSKINLISKNTVEKAGDKHFADSYLGLQTFAKQLPSDVPIFDFGSGNGFPGLIAAMVFPDRKIVLVERDQRKAEFLKIAVSHLRLTNVEVHAGSVGDLNDAACEIVISRAMAPLPKFLLESRRVMKPGGIAYLFKGDTWTTEFGSCPPQVFDYWDINVIGSYTLPIEGAARFAVACTRLP